VPLILSLAQHDASYGLMGAAIGVVEWNLQQGFGTVQHWDETRAARAH
jgi:hypothetical protein